MSFWSTERWLALKYGGVGLFTWNIMNFSKMWQNVYHIYSQSMIISKKKRSSVSILLFSFGALVRSPDDARNQAISRHDINTLRPRQNGRHFADDVLKCIFLNENVWISLKISLKYVPKGPINNIPSLVQIMAWRRPGDKPLSEPMMVSLLTHICVTQPQRVNLFCLEYFYFHHNQQQAYLSLTGLNPVACTLIPSDAFKVNHSKFNIS